MKRACSTAFARVDCPPAQALEHTTRHAGLCAARAALSRDSSQNPCAFVLRHQPPASRVGQPSTRMKLPVCLFGSNMSQATAARSSPAAPMSFFSSELWLVSAFRCSGGDSVRLTVAGTTVCPSATRSGAPQHALSIQRRFLRPFGHHGIGRPRLKPSLALATRGRSRASRSRLIRHGASELASSVDCGYAALYPGGRPHASRCAGRSS